MWVRTQDGMRAYQITNVFIEADRRGERYTLYSGSYDMQCTMCELGVYTSELRAKEVLTEILVKIARNDGVPVYIMPEK